MTNQYLTRRKFINSGGTDYTTSPWSVINWDYIKNRYEPLR